MDIVLLHGYNVTSTKTYGVLPQRLKSAGHKIKDVYLSKYITLDDGVNMADLVKAFHAALLDMFGAQWEKKEVACITHSTGALVVRSWIDTYYSHRMKALPLTHFIMLAPPNNGSRLASLGKSRLSRLRNLVGVKPGLKILDALETGSRFQWDLNSTWITEKRHATPGFFPFVIAGQWIDKQLWDVIIPATYERGSDGVVRAASGNLNMQKYTVKPDGSVLQEVMGGIPYLITPQTSHSDASYGIVGSIPSKGDHPVLSAILEALDVEDRRSYVALESEFATETALLQRQEKYHDGSRLDRYSQIVFHVVDNMGNHLNDYAVELLDANGRGDQLPTGFFAHQYQSEGHPEFFTYYLNYDRLAGLRGGKFGFRLQVVADSSLVSYSEGGIENALPAVDEFLRPNQTTYVEVVLRRRLNKNMFRLTKNLSEQKIIGRPGPDWIE